MITKINGDTIGRVRKYIIVDRDGCINKSNKTDDDRGPFVLSVDDFTFTEGTPKALAKLSRAGYNIIVLTSQACVPMGYISESELDNIHKYMVDVIEEHGGRVLDIKVVYPDDDADSNIVEKSKCKYRAIRELMSRYNISIEDEVWCIGDSLWDVMGGELLGFNTVQIRVKNYEGTFGADYVCNSLLDASDIIINGRVSHKHHIDGKDIVTGVSLLSTTVNYIENVLHNLYRASNNIDTSPRDELEVYHIKYSTDNIINYIRNIEANVLRIME